MEWVNGCVATSDFSYEIYAVREVIPFFCNFILSILHHNQWVFVPYGSEILFISLLFKWIDSIGRFTPSFPKPAIIVCRFISFVIPLWALSRWIFELVLRNISKKQNMNAELWAHEIQCRATVMQFPCGLSNKRTTTMKKKEAIHSFSGC